MLTKIDDQKIKNQPNIEMLKIVMEKKKVKLARPFRNYIF